VKKKKAKRKISKRIAKAASEYVMRFEEKQVEIVRAVTALVDSGLTYMEALVEYAVNNDIEVEALAEVVNANAPLKQALQEEAANLRLIKFANTAKLPQI
jgi:hypothetical protein